MEACMADVLVGVMQLLGCPFDGAWCLFCELCLLAVICVDCRCSLSFGFLSGARFLELSSCYTEKATDARHCLERQYNACANRKKQCRPNKTKPYSNATHPRKRQNNPTNGHTLSRIKSTHTAFSV